MTTNSVLRDFPADEAAAAARGVELLEQVRRLRLGELMVLLSTDQAGPVNELMDPEALTLAATDAFETLGLEAVRNRVLDVWVPLNQATDPGDYVALSMFLFGGPEDFYRLISMARRIHLAAGLLPL